VEHQEPAAVSAKGFALVEWLIASMLVITLAGAVFAVVIPVRDVIARTQQRVDLVSGARGALDLLLADLREAGAGPGVQHATDDFARVLPPIVLMGDLDSPFVSAPATAIAIHRVPSLAAQGRLAAAAVAGDSVLRLTITTRCPSSAPACGFTPGDHAVLFTNTTSELVRVAAVFNDSVALTAGVTRDFPVDAVLSRVVTTTYGVRPSGADFSLVRRTDGGAEQALLDHVVKFELGADNPKASASRLVTVRLRVQTAAAHLRGPAGDLFVHGGTASGPRQWIPDIELRAELALRNVSEVP
jgi:type II secretory pathway pseudopilin PulG